MLGNKHILHTAIVKAQHTIFACILSRPSSSQVYSCSDRKIIMFTTHLWDGSDNLEIVLVLVFLL